jgi:hypothetical protein
LAQRTDIFLAATFSAVLLIAGNHTHASVSGGVNAFVEGDYGKVLLEFKKVLKKKKKPQKAQLIMARMYLDGLGVPVNYSRAYQYLLPAADKGNAWAQTELAHLIAAGRGPMQSYQRANEYYLKAAKAGFGPAQLALGRALYKGLGTAQNSLMAYAWLNLAATELKEPERRAAVIMRDQAAQLMSRNDIARAQDQSLKWSDEIVGEEPEIAALLRRTRVKAERMSAEAMGKRVGDLVKAVGMEGAADDIGKEIASIGKKIGEQLDKKTKEKLASELKAPGAAAGKSMAEGEKGFFASMMSSVSGFFSSLFGSDEPGPAPPATPAKSPAAKAPAAKTATPDARN